jgi:hypothetical protein
MISNDSVSSTTLANCSRFMLHPRVRSLRVAVVCVVIIVIFFFAVVLLFVFFLIRLLPKANRGGYRGIRAVWGETVWRYGGHV